MTVFLFFWVFLETLEITYSRDKKIYTSYFLFFLAYMKFSRIGIYFGPISQKGQMSIIVSLQHPQVLPTTDGKYSGKKNSKKTWTCHMLATSYTACTSADPWITRFELWGATLVHFFFFFFPQNKYCKIQGWLNSWLQRADCKSYPGIFNRARVSAPNTYVVQGSTVHCIYNSYIARTLS